MSRGEVELSAGRIAVRFERRGDRWGHTIVVDGQPALVSVEGAPDEAWPASPPLQEIHEQALPDGRRAIFGVGMAGRSHWSLAVTAESESLRFEAACRVFGPTGPLGSAYVQVAQPAVVLSATVGTRLTHDGDRLRLAPETAATFWNWSCHGSPESAVSSPLPPGEG